MSRLRRFLMQMVASQRKGGVATVLGMTPVDGSPGRVLANGVPITVQV
jgi:hypothetical protein